MPLQTSGPISLFNIGSEFNDTAPYSLSEYFNATAGIPTSGPISIGSFYGKSSTFEVVITSNTSILNAFTFASNSGWDQTTNLLIRINSGVIVGSSSISNAALNVSGVYPYGITIENNGTIVGMGGAGATGVNGSTTGTVGGAGGTAIAVSSPVTIINNGVIAGGGGGGSSGTGGSYKRKASSTTSTPYRGGGGGGGQSSLTDSPFGTGTYVNGTAGTYSAAGLGGTGGTRGGDGGNGGSWGQSGAAGGAPSGGAGGAAVIGNANITWAATGTRYGIIS